LNDLVCRKFLIEGFHRFCRASDSIAGDIDGPVAHHRRGGASQGAASVHDFETIPGHERKLYVHHALRIAVVSAANAALPRNGAAAVRPF